MKRDARVKGDETNLSQFSAALARNRAAQGEMTPLPAREVSALRAVPPDADLVARFTQAARAAGCHVHCSGESECVAAITALLQAAGARRALVEPQPGTALPPERAAALIDALTTAGVAACQSYDDETLFAADASVTGVRLAVAETGTLVCVSGPASARAASLVPPLHVAIVSGSQIVPDLFDAFEHLGQAGSGTAAASCISFITGPSKTADIEGVLITGVHGPGQVHIVIVPN